MATSVVILCLNAKRINIKVTPNTSILQVLEQACSKQNLNAHDYDLVHQRKVLDLSLSVRFANLPNNALLELRPSQGNRQESKVAVCVQTEDGERLVYNFPPSSTFWDILSHWLNEIGEKRLRGDAVDDAEPVCLYMRKEVVGENQLRETSLRSLGLTSGSAVIRIFYRKPESLKTQAYVESINLKPKIEENSNKNEINSSRTQEEPTGWDDEETVTGRNADSNVDVKMETVESESVESQDHSLLQWSRTSVTEDKWKSVLEHPVTNSGGQRLGGPSDMSDHRVEDILEVNEEIIYVGGRDAVLYDARNVVSHATEILPDDFFEVTVEDARYLYATLQKQRKELENQMLCTQSFKEAKKMERMLQFKNTVLRIQFPNQLVLQARFATLEKVSDVAEFVSQFLVDEGSLFQLFTTPPKTILNQDHALYEAGLVPASLVHFGCDHKSGNILKPELLSKVSSHRAACKAAALIRQSSKANDTEYAGLTQQIAPQIQSQNELPERSLSEQAGPSTSKPSTSQVPKWFRTGPK